MDYGVSDDRSSKLATPAIKAYNKVAGTYEQAWQKRGQPLLEGFTIVKVRCMHRLRPVSQPNYHLTSRPRARVPQAPTGLTSGLARDFHLVNALTRLQLTASTTNGPSGNAAACVSFSHRNLKMTLFKGKDALEARRDVARKLMGRPRTIDALRRSTRSEIRRRTFQKKTNRGVPACPFDQ